MTVTAARTASSTSKKNDMRTGSIAQDQGAASDVLPSSRGSNTTANTVTTSNGMAATKKADSNRQKLPAVSRHLRVRSQGLPRQIAG